MQKIIPHLWFDKNAEDAIKFYISLFDDSKLENKVVLKDTPSGDADSFVFKLAGQDFMAINGGPFFKLNPSISFFTFFDNEDSIDEVWKKLSDGGKVLMALEKYAWANKYGWVEDKFGMSWQLSLNDKDKPIDQKIIPSFLFTQGMAGKTEEAIKFYTSIFPDSKVETIVPYAKGEGDVEGYTKFSQFELSGQKFIAMDSSAPHQFVFNEALSMIVNCKDQAEIDFFWEKLSAVPESEACGWCKDKYGVSWQINPSVMNKMMNSGDDKAIYRVVQELLKMKKCDVQKLTDAFENGGEV